MSLLRRAARKLARFWREESLRETIVDIAKNAQHVGYHPDDSREFTSSCISWALEFERRFWKLVDKGVWQEDDYLEKVDDFVFEKLREVKHLCVRWPAAWS